MTRLVLCVLLAFFLATDTCCVKLDECPPGYRCRPKMFGRIRRSIGDDDQQGLDVEICPPGTFSPGGVFECTPCTDGTYTADPGAAACHICPQGHMCQHTDKVPELCPTGTYNNLTQQTCCRTCARGQFAGTKGMFQCFDCPAGHKCQSIKKLRCEEKDSTCVPFWKMPESDQGTHFTYPNGNIRISGDISRSVCATFRANDSNDNNIIYSIGSFDTTWTGEGCNTHFTLTIRNATHIDVYGMCTDYDNKAIFLGGNTLYDGDFHQICVTYNNTESKLCIYLDSQTPQCLIRQNLHYNTALGDVRIGWWPDNNRQFSALGDGLIRSVSLFDRAISPQCVADQRVPNA